MAVDFELRDRARDLCVVDGYTIEQASKETGVPERTIANWSTDEGWVEARKEHRQALSDIRRKRVMLRKALIEKAMTTLDPQDIYAAARLEAASGKKETDTVVVADIDRPRLFLENLEFVADVLKGIDPEGLKVLARSFEEIVKRFKEKVGSKE